MVVVCAGAKAILDLPAHLKCWKPWFVPVIGFGTDDFPAFYSTSSGLPVNVRVDTPEEVAAIARAHWGMGQTTQFWWSIRHLQTLPCRAKRWKRSFIRRFNQQPQRVSTARV
jgi:hypothetical protein